MDNVKNVSRYSVDKEIWVGMKTQDANTTDEKMKLFNFADQNGDGEISESELDRYNGPLLIENFPEKTGRIIGHAGPYSMNGLILMDNEVDYYPGLQIEQVDKAGRVVYSQIDTDHSGVLSAKEMEAVADAKQKVDETEKKINKIQNIRTDLSIAGVCGTLICGVLSDLYSEAGNIKKYIQILGGKGRNVKEARAFAIASVVCIGLTIANRFVAKHKAKKALEDIQDVNHPYIDEKKEELKTIV